MYELALFAGAGGGILGAMLCGHTVVGAVEIEEYPREVLKQRQRDGILDEFPIWDDVTTFRSDNQSCRDYMQGLWEIKDQLVISGGFPCQDISAAGKGAGIKKGTRSGLWFEFSRIVGEIQPARVFVENSPLLISRGLDIVLSDLAEMGYDAKWGIIGADAVGCQHKRYRAWVVANANKSKRRWQCRRERRCYTSEEKRDLHTIQNKSMPAGMVDDVANRVDRLNAIGNGQVPAVVRLAWDILG